MLITLIVVQSDLLRQPLLYMSPWLERHKTRYVDLMYEVSRKGEWLPWISFFLEAVSESALGTIRVVERLQALQMRYRERFQKASQSGLLPRIIDLAFEQPALTQGRTEVRERVEQNV